MLSTNMLLSGRGSWIRQRSSVRTKDASSTTLFLGPACQLFVGSHSFKLLLLFNKSTNGIFNNSTWTLKLTSKAFFLEKFCNQGTEDTSQGKDLENLCAKGANYPL